ncbi:MAG: NAD(+) diphosphatase [Anaerolineales bacterium]|nr:NAD(+) diphosphatase [Anaerolineales bacterium]
MHIFNSSLTTPPDPTAVGWWFAFRRSQLLIFRQDTPQIPRATDLQELGLTAVRQQYLGQFQGQDCYAAELSDDIEPPPNHEFATLRQLFHQIDTDLFQIAGRAVQMVAWERDHQFCGRCATPTITATDRAKICPNCNLRAYPRLAPAVIMAVVKEDKLLLGHGIRHPKDMYSVLAGFAEPGETLEETVAREVQEEVGLAVKNIRYFGSQPWPFPNSLMIGFVADYAGGDIILEDEIEAADWFTAEEIRTGKVFVPPASISIAGQLIEWFLELGRPLER